MSTTIKCPNCRHEFAMEEAVSEQYKKDLREQMIEFTRKKEEEFQKKDLGISPNNCRIRKKAFQQEIRRGEKNLFSRNWKKIYVKPSIMILKTGFPFFNSQMKNSRRN